MRFLLKLLAYAAGLAAAAWLLEGIYFLGASDGGSKELDAKILPLLGVSLILAVVNTIVTPVIKMLSFPLLLVTLGLFMLVINALMLLLTAEIAENVGLNFQVDGLFSAGIGAVIVTVVTWILDAALDD
ncbi:phage holin family protein [Nocardioides sp.]|uniref:phage holin family protein n=1 Tax=Nocardioides sp. TaxID=35761 RepID=UPI002BD9A16B|nr:phage holin family protein [Nocardioides sp.]HXH79104.1 phage holin family protein [Nocardioides sp.]